MQRVADRLRETVRTTKNPHGGLKPADKVVPIRLPNVRTTKNPHGGLKRPASSWRPWRRSAVRTTKNPHGGLKLSDVHCNPLFCNRSNNKKSAWRIETNRRCAATYDPSVRTTKNPHGGLKLRCGEAAVRPPPDGSNNKKSAWRIETLRDLSARDRWALVRTTKNPHGGLKPRGGWSEKTTAAEFEQQKIRMAD